MSNHSKLPLSETKIDIWLAFYGEIADEPLLANMRDLLTETERQQQARFYFADDRKRYLVTRALVRTVLSRYAAVDPSDWTFSTNAYGRPVIANRLEDAAGLSFNISHTRGLIALAVGLHRELGVDVENLVAREVSIDIADHFFSPPEVAELAGVPRERSQDRFFEYWTFKESYIKARGMGLSLPLDKFSFLFPHERGVRIAIDAELGDDENRWSFWQYRPTTEYLLALCAEKRAGTATVVTMRKVIPTAGHDAFETALLKTSETDLA